MTKISRRSLVTGSAMLSATAYGSMRMLTESDAPTSSCSTAKERSVGSALQSAAALYRNVHDFGAKGDGTTDDYHAVMSALSHLRADSPDPAPHGDEHFASSGTLYFPPGRYRMSRTVSLKQQIRLLGETRGSGQGPATQLVFPADTTGILINRHDTDDMDGIASPTTSAEGSVIEGIAVVAVGPPTAGNPATGIYARARCTLIRCEASGFARDGIALIANDVAPHLGNCNASVIRDCSVQHNGRHGLWLAGNNANACVIENLNAVLNGGYGFRDETLIGQTWIGGHTASNGQLLSGPYRTTAIVWHAGKLYALLPGSGHADAAACAKPDVDPKLWSLREESVAAPFPDIPAWQPGIALAEGGAGYIGAGRHVHINPYTEGRQGPYYNNGAIALGGSPGAGFVGNGINVYASEGHLEALGRSATQMNDALRDAWISLKETFGV